MMYVLTVYLKDAEALTRLASVVTGVDTAQPDGNTLELTLDGPAMSRRIARMYEREFPADPNTPLPGQLTLPGVE